MSTHLVTAAAILTAVTAVLAATADDNSTAGAGDRIERALASVSARLDSVRALNTFLGGGSGSGGEGGGIAAGLNVGSGDRGDGDKTCEYRCPSGGRKPQPRAGYRPTFNGCGSQEFKIDTSQLPEITSCCNHHDICYGTCNKPKLTCEDQFRSCLIRACDAMQRAGNLRTQAAYDTCRNLGATFVETVENFGCDFYLDAQEEACDCGEDKSRTEQVYRGRPSNSKLRPTGSGRHPQDQAKKQEEPQDNDGIKRTRTFLDFGLSAENDEL